MENENELENDIIDQIGDDTLTTDTIDDKAETDAEQDQTDTTTQQTSTLELTGDLSTDTRNNQSIQNKQKEKQVNNSKDLVDANGNIIATQGADRRHYENLQKSKQREAELTTANQQLQTQVDAFNSVNSIGKELGITNAEVESGARIIAAYKTDPIGTLNHLLTQAQAAGYNVGEVSGSNNDMAAIKQMLQEVMAPITLKTQQEQEQLEYKEQATKEYNNFIGVFPDASIHETSIARLLKEQPNLSLEAAYYKLRSFYGINNLDWTKPIETLQKEQDTIAKDQDVSRQTPPTGNTLNNTNATSNASEAVDPNMSFDEIIRQSMQEANIN